MRSSDFVNHSNDYRPNWTPLSLPLRTLSLFEGVNFTTYFFFRDKMPIDMNILVFFLGKCVRNAAKPWLWTEKKTEGTSSAIFGSGPLPNATNSSVVPTEFAAE